jgi:adenosylhomocysteinase
MSTPALAAIPSDVRDLALAERGKRRIEWAFQSMCVLQGIRKHFIKEQPFARYRIAACLHISPEAANLMITLRDGGANLMLCAASPSSTHDDVAACLVKDYGIPVFGICGENHETFVSHIGAVLAHEPQIVIDDGCTLTAALHENHEQALAALIGGTEDTAIGVARLRVAARENQLDFPVVAVGEAVTKQLFENRYGTGQGILDALLRVTGILVAGLNVVVIGYGSCGRGIAQRARGLGASVSVAEVDPVRAVEAVMEGYRVLSLAEAAVFGDVFITATGNKNVINREHLDKFKNGAMLCNAGHSNIEIDSEALAQAAFSRRHTRDFVEEFAMRDGRRLYLLGDGRLINLNATEGQPPSVMDIALANHALAAEYLVKNRKSLQKSVIAVPYEIDRQVAKIKLESMSVKIDRLTVEQEQYLANRFESA